MGLTQTASILDFFFLNNSEFYAMRDNGVNYFFYTLSLIEFFFLKYKCFLKASSNWIIQLILHCTFYCVYNWYSGTFIFVLQSTKTIKHDKKLSTF